ncbi:TetR/AcrR family transcriptional regulator [Daejeonella oryzae]|uniref:TetR/AcrR family transcriptional regulator n=1 Tax=Daejeonella oryzae TaxID=1122943 RepID=UPI00041B01C4|nr:TetR/AcrR family transcriptional regulator [Daejeonella oryzae]
MENQVIPVRKPKRTKDKELAKLELIQAVAEIIRTKGYTGLGVNKIAQKAGLHKKLIYRYFGNVDNLIEQYIVEKDFWIIASEELSNKAAVNSESNLEDVISTILEQQFHFFYNEQEMQELILWELSGKSFLMNSISKAREELGEKFLTLTDKYFEDSDINFRALSALLTAGIYYIILHSRVSTFCGLDIRNKEDKEEILRTLKLVIHRAFESAKKK